MNKNKEKITSITSITNIASKTMLLLALMSYMGNATTLDITLDNRLTNRQNKIERSLLCQILSLIFSMIIFISIAVSLVPVASASGGAYTLKWYAADPEVDRAPYLPTYEKLTPSQLACPGTDGRYPDLLNDSVAYGPAYNSSNLDAVTSLAPKDIALGQIVPFEVEISVNGDTGPENRTINFTGGWNTNTTSGDNFGYDPAYMVYCAFVDTADPGTIDPGNNTKVDAFTSELTNPGTKDEEIQGIFQISGLDNGDNVVVEVWVVLKPTIPLGSTGNVQSRLVSAQTVATEPDDINTGNQVIPLLRVQEFFSADADISVNKTDSPDPVIRGQYLNYTLLVKNNSPETIANGVNVTDTLDTNTTFVSASGAPYNNTTSTVTFNVGALSPGQNITLFVNTTVSDTAPAQNDNSTNPGPGSTTLPAIYDVLNSVSVTSITDDSNITNNTYYQPTNVLPAFEPSATLNLLKQISNSSTGPWSDSITVPGGSDVYYNFTIINTGNVPLSSLSINDSLVDTSGIIPPWPEPLEPLASASRIVGPVTAETLAGTYNNTATANGAYNNETYESGPSSANYTVTGAPAYTIDKIVTDVAGKGSTANVTKAGDVIGYRINVTNTGKVDLTNITVNDPLLETLTGPTESKNADEILEAGENWVFTGNYTVTQADMNNNGGGDGLINNTATVDSDELSPQQDSETVPIEQNAAYTIDKTVTDVAGKGQTANVTKAGDIITYQINVINTGNIDLTNLTVNDTLIPDANLTGPNGDSNDPGVLNSGEKWTYTENYTVTQKDINSNGEGDGVINNTATVDSDELLPQEDTAEVPIEEIPIEENPAYTINKTVTNVAGKGPTANVTKAGDVIGYRINVTNNGNVDLTNITVNDTLIAAENITGPTGDNAPTGVLDIGETWIYTGTYKVTQADINNNGGEDGVINNTATVDSDQLGPKSDNAEVPIEQKLEELDYCIYKSIIGVDKAGDCIINEPGDIIEYQIAVKNIGKGNLTNVTVNDSLITLTGPTGDNINPGILNPGETWKYKGNYTVTQEDINSNGGGDGDIDNTATVSSNELPDENSSVQQPIVQTPDYCIYKSIIGVDQAGDCIINEPGDIIEYQIAVKNIGNVDLTGVSVNDTLINLTGPTGDNIEPGVLNPGEKWKYKGNYTVTQEDINSNGGGDGDIDNTATVSCNELPDENSSVQQPITQKLDLCIYKSIIGVDQAGDCIINEPGDIIEYQIAVKNNGKGNLTNITVNDSIIENLTGPTGDKINPGILNPGETWKYKGNYTVTQEDINSNGGSDGDIDNTATVSSNELPDENSTKEQPIVQTPDYCIYKSIIGADRAGDCIINEAGDVIEYQIAVKNIGNVDLTGVSVNDTLINLTGPTGDDLDPQVLNPGETWKYKGNYTVTQDDINSNGSGDGDIDNTATVSCNELPDESSSKEQLILLTSISTNNADITPTPTDDVDQNEDNDSGDGGSSGGGGGGGGSPEPAGNVEVKELAQAFVTNGKEAKFNFTKNVTCVVYVSFDSKKTMDKITTIVEMLKRKSTLTPDAPEGEVYDYLNIWVGSGGYATEQNIENAVICFKVEKSWMEENSINESSITLKRYNDGKWNHLPVSLLKEDDKFLYFTAETPGFSHFAITGQTKNGLNANTRGMESESKINTSEEDTEDTEDTESETEQKNGQSTPGFELVYGLACLLGIFLYRRK